MAKRSLMRLLLCLALVIATVGMAAANLPELMVYSGTIPQGVNQGDGTYEISFSIYATEHGGSALWTETQNVYVYRGAFAVYLGAVQKLNLSFDVPYWVGVKTGDKEDIWPLTGAGYPAPGSVAGTSTVNAAITPELVAADEVKSANIKEADGTTGQNTNTGSGIKTNHIQNAAVTAAKIKAGAVTTAKIESGAVTDAKITGPISTAKLNVGTASDTVAAGNHTHNYGSKYVNVTGDTMTGPLVLSIDAASTFPKALHIKGAYGAVGNGRSIVFGDAADYVRLRDVVEAGAQVGFSIDTSGNQSRLYVKHGGNVGIGTTNPKQKLSVAGTIESTAGGFKFPDDTTQTTASKPTWSQIIPGAGRWQSVLGGTAALDRETGLVWRRAATGVNTNYSAATNSCHQSGLGGRKGWRLPTIEELSSLVDTTVSNPALPESHPFTDAPDILSSLYWSSTTYEFNTAGAWVVDFGSGNVGIIDTDGGGYVRCVRGGQ